MKKDKTQGVVFVLPKSKEFFGRIQDQPNKTTDIMGSADIASKKKSNSFPAAKHHDHAKKELESLQDLKSNLTKLNQLHNKLKTMLDELDDIVKK